MCVKGNARNRNAREDIRKREIHENIYRRSASVRVGLYLHGGHIRGGGGGRGSGIKANQSSARKAGIQR